MKSFFNIVIIFFSVFVKAQIIEGFVTNEDTNLPIRNVKVTLIESGAFTYTNSKGYFRLLASSEKPKVSFQSSKTKETVMALSSGVSHKIKLIPYSIKIDGITLTAKRNKFSEIEIKEEALHNLQSFSVADVLQQLPGQFVKPFSLNSFQNITFRTASSEGVGTSVANYESLGNKSFGVAVLVNNIAMGNNANMQSYLPGVHSPFEQNYNSFSVESNHYAVGDPRRTIKTNNSNFGFDLRKIPLGNISKIKIIGGVPSAKYGDLTSGLVLIENKAGEKPLVADVSMKESVIQANISKGLEYGKNGNAVNIGFSYLDSNIDPRDHYVNYKRIEGNILWGVKNALGTFDNQVSLSYSQNIDDAKTDPDNVDRTTIKNRQYAFRINNNLEWQNPLKFLDLLKLDIGFSYEKQNSYRESFENNGAQPYSDALVSGVYYGKYTPVAFTLINKINGIPIMLFANMELMKNLKQGENVKHRIIFGASHQLSDNVGKGREGDQRQFLMGSGSVVNGFRPYDFDENVKAQNQFSAYTEDEIHWDFGFAKLNTVAGLRFDYQNNTPTLSPRINVAIGKKPLNLRAGFGLMTKAPSLDMVYTGKRYLDLLLGDYRVPGVYSRAIVQTIVTSPDYTDLKPSKSKKYELGMDWHNKILDFSITAYKSILEDGFSLKPFIERQNISSVVINTNSILPPVFDVVGTREYNYLSGKNTNGLTSEDTGIEALVQFKEIKPLKLTIVLNGNYVKTKNKYNFESYEKAKSISNGILYGIYTPRNDMSENLSLSGSYTYHSAHLGLIIQIISNHFLIDKIYRENSVGFPIAYINKDFDRINIEEKDRDNANLYAEIIQSYNDRHEEKLSRILHNFHLRITKEFGNGFRLSIYGNNFLNIYPTYYHPYYKRVMPYRNFAPFSFGAELNFKF